MKTPSLHNRINQYYVFTQIDPHNKKSVMASTAPPARVEPIGGVYPTSIVHGTNIAMSFDHR